MKSHLVVTVGLLMVQVILMNGYFIFEKENEWMFIDRNDVNESLQVERYKRSSGSTYEPNDIDKVEYEFAGPYFIAVSVVDARSKSSQTEIHNAIQKVNDIFTLDNFMPKLHVVLQSIQLATDPTTSTTINEAISEVRTKYSNKGSDMTIVVSSKKFTGQNDPNVHEQWMEKESKGKLCALGKNVVLVTPDSGPTLEDGMAHEIGWMLGMNIDICGSGSSCQAHLKRTIMSPSYQYRGVEPGKWSAQSVQSYQLWSIKSTAICIKDKPTGGAFPVCGNGIMESKESCDCIGYEAECKKCCDMTTCNLKSGASCYPTGGNCCTNCKQGKSGDVCREARDSCDLAEKCDSNKKCPKDLFRKEKESCKINQTETVKDGACNAKGMCVPLAPGATAAPKKGGSDWWKILLIVLGAILLALLIALLVYCCLKRKKENEGTASTAGSTTGSTSGPSTTSGTAPASKVVVVTPSKAGPSQASKPASQATGSKVPTASQATGSKAPSGSKVGSKAASGSKVGSKAASGSKVGSKSPSGSKVASGTPSKSGSKSGAGSKAKT